MQGGNPNESGSSSAAPTPAECGARAKPKAMPVQKFAPRPKVQAALPKSAGRSLIGGQLSSQTGQLSSQTATAADDEKEHSCYLNGSKVCMLH